MYQDPVLWVTQVSKTNKIQPLNAFIDIAYNTYQKLGFRWYS